jgi:hypothetical protein
MGVSKAKGGLGFRDLVVFNKALLAKQVWRLYQQPDSLVGQIFKAKYYPNCTVLEATKGKKPSLVWRSLTAAQEVIIRGAIWQVGDGKSIKVWGDSWVPVPTTFKIQALFVKAPSHSPKHLSTVAKSTKCHEQCKSAMNSAAWGNVREFNKPPLNLPALISLKVHWLQTL